jgi:ankyrin repeat protein
VNAFDKRDRRAIHWATFMGHAEIVQNLIDFGAEVNCRDKEVSKVLLYTNCRQIHISICSFVHISQTNSCFNVQNKLNISM